MITFMKNKNVNITVCLLLTAILTAQALCGCTVNVNINPADGHDVSGNSVSEDYLSENAGREISYLSRAIRDEEFGAIYIDLSIDEFNALGFSFGDSVDIAFDNGTNLNDIPYYSGYYGPLGGLLICSYPGNPHPAIARNYGDSTWEEFDLKDTSTVTITLSSKGKYLDTQELFNLKYSDHRNDYGADEEFSNFREISGGQLKSGHFFRSASPCDNRHGRAGYADKLARDHNIQFVLNLAETPDKYSEYAASDDYDFPYYDGLYKDGRVLLLALNANYRSDEFAAKTSNAFLEMTKQDGPVLIHCLEGKDRTGSVCALLLALAGASADEIVQDYMITYTNYYGITKEGDPKKYEAIEDIMKSFLTYICSADEDADISTLDLRAWAENYLKKGGLSEDEITAIEEYITAF